MYRSDLEFKFYGITDEVVNVWKSTEPLTNFDHYFAGDELPVDKLVLPVIVLAPQAEITPEEGRKKFGKDAVIILCTDEPEKLAEKELTVLDDVWPFTMPETMWRFHIGRLLRSLDEKRRHYFFEHCLHTSINMLPDLIWYKDVKGSHLKVNDAFCECVAKEKSDVEGRGHYYIWGLTEEMYKKGEFVCLETEQAVLEKREVCVFDEQVQDQNGDLRELKTWKAPIFDEDGKTLIGTVGIARDVTLENQYRRRIEAMAYTDYLTGVSNRLAFYKFMEENRKTWPITMVYIDADHFKSINDTYGHKAGDEAIILIANGLKQHFANDFITRLGGDEFLVTILGKFTKENLKKSLDTFMKNMAEKFQKDERFRVLSFSMGIAYTEDTNVWGGELIHRGDLALYEAKRRGRACYVFYDEMSEEMKREAEASGVQKREDIGDGDNRSAGV